MLNRARAIENGSFVLAAAQGGKHENGRETFGHSLVVDPGAASSPRAAPSPAWCLADVDPAEVAAARAQIPRSSMAGASRSSSRWRSRRTCMRCEAPHDPLRARLRRGPRVRELVPELGRLRQAGQARPRHLPGLRLGQGREGDHGAALAGAKKRGAIQPGDPGRADRGPHPRRPRRSPWCRRRSASCARSSRSCAST